jgi:hypothetical protein
VCCNSSSLQLQRLCCVCASRVAQRLHPGACVSASGLSRPGALCMCGCEHTSTVTHTSPC